MAIKNVDLYSENTREGLPAIQPAQGPGSVIVRTFDAVAGGGTLPVGTPVYVAAATGLLLKCNPTAASGEALVVYGFVYPTPITLDDSGVGDADTVGTVMTAGSIDYDVIKDFHSGAGGDGTLLGTSQELIDLLRKVAMHNKRLHVDNLTKIGGNDGLAL